MFFAKRRFVFAHAIVLNKRKTYNTIHFIISPLSLYHTFTKETSPLSMCSKQIQNLFFRA